MRSPPPATPGAPCSAASCLTRSALTRTAVGTGDACGTTRTGGVGCAARAGAGAPLGSFRTVPISSSAVGVKAVDVRHLHDADAGLRGERAERVARADDVRALRPRRAGGRPRDDGARAGARRDEARARQRGRALGDARDLQRAAEDHVRSWRKTVVDGDGAGREVALGSDRPQRLAAGDGVQHVGSGGRGREQRGGRRKRDDSQNAHGLLPWVSHTLPLATVHCTFAHVVTCRCNPPCKPAQVRGRRYFGVQATPLCVCASSSRKRSSGCGSPRK